MQNILIISLSAVGIAITLYLNIAHVLKKKVICPISSESCKRVLDSKYSRTFGLKNEAIGLAYYLIILLSVFMVMPKSFLVIISGFAAIYSIILLIIQIKIIKNYCSWCILTAIINIRLFVLIAKL